MQNISPFLWFDHQAEEAATLYTSVFKNSRILNVTRYPEGSPAPAGSAMSVTFEIDGLRVQALNAGPTFQFTEAISLFVNANTQAEIDDYWNALTADGGEPSQCGWLKDKFGLSWQIVPAVLGELLSDPDPEKSGRTMQAMLAMHKIDIAALHAAHDGTNLDTA
ncbi:VOC family protein [Cryobacterium melibiosiphilum]|uniref:VOC family protein n=1 Tax=Cryobacterium melibiosiphilum TaxID=995039 RepID=A0A3A5MFQ7_9MICO|nr:VOC family protein [Cryobacterium melibiosiphilum]RJT88262.1 VOC family protein [Cryobacterium melibiosiphilum]